MKTKLILSVLTILMASSISAQKSFFETLDSHGPNAKYQGHGNVYENSEGKQVLRPWGEDELMHYITRHDFQGLSSGITVKRLFKDGDLQLVNNYDGIQISAIKQIGFPNTSILYHSGYNQGYVAIDNAVFFIKGISKDQTDFREIGAVMILDGSASQKEGKGKKKKGKFWNKLKDAALASGSAYEGKKTPEYKALAKKDIEQLVKDYLKQMKAKQNAYTMTPQDKSNIAMIYNGAKSQDAEVKKKNDAYWASEAGQRVLRNRATVDKVHADHLRTCRTSGCDNNAHN